MKEILGIKMLFFQKSFAVFLLLLKTKTAKKDTIFLQKRMQYFIIGFNCIIHSYIKQVVQMK